MALPTKLLVPFNKLNGNKTLSYVILQYSSEQYDTVS